MANWRNLFKPWILSRGQEYFECGQVVELKEVDSIVFGEQNIENLNRNQARGKN